MNFETKLNMLVHMTIVHTTTSEIIDDEELEYELCLKLLWKVSLINMNILSRVQI